MKKIFFVVLLCIFSVISLAQSYLVSSSIFDDEPKSVNLLAYYYDKSLQKPINDLKNVSTNSYWNFVGLNILDEYGNPLWKYNVWKNDPSYYMILNSNKKVLSLDSYNGAYVVGYGTAKVSVLLANGLMDTVNINVPFPKNVYIDICSYDENHWGVENKMHNNIILTKGTRYFIGLSSEYGYGIVPFPVESSNEKIVKLKYVYDVDYNYILDIYFTPEVLGKATISVTFPNGVSNYANVIIKDTIESAKISPKPLDLVVGQKGELNVTVNPKTASKDSLKWQLAPLNSSDIATIDSNGVVTAKKEGSVKIWLTDGKKLYDTCDVHIYPPCFFVIDEKGNYSKIDNKLDKKEYTLYPGYVKGLNNISLAGRKFNWSSDKPEAISVDQKGKITYNGSGEEAIITAESEGITIQQKLKYKVNNFEIRHNYTEPVTGDIRLKSGTITLDEPIKLLYLVKKDTNEVIPLDDSVNLNFKVEIEKTSTKYAPVYYKYYVKGTLGLYAQEPNSQGKIRIYGKYKGEKFDVTEDVIVKKIHLYIMEKQLYNIYKEVTLAGLLSTPMGVLGFFNIEIPIYKAIDKKIHPLDDVQLVAVRTRTVLEEMTDVIWETNNKNISITQGKITFNCQEINEDVQVNVKNISNTMTGKVTLRFVKNKPDIILLHGDGVKNNKEGDFKMNVGEENVYVEAFPKNLKRNDNGNGVTISLDKTLGVDATFKSDKPNVLSVDSNGLLTTNNKVKEKKSVKITATTKDGKTAKVVVTVCPVKVKSVKITNSVRSKVGGTFTLTPTITPKNATNKDVLWSSDNSSVAVVNGNGVVTCKKVGTAKITVTTEDGNKTSTCKVTVTKY